MSNDDQNVNAISSDPDEAALVARAQARDPEAWTVIYDRHYQALFRYIYARVYDRDTAADLAATVFVSAINGIPSYKYTGRPLLAWLYTIARNTVAGHQRRALGRRSLDRIGSSVRAATRMFRSDEREPVAAGTASQADEMAERIDLHRAIAKLPESQREVLILRFLVGLSTEEIAEVVGKERVAVYSLHARAITTLRQSLSEHAPKQGKSHHRDENLGPSSINMVRGKKS
jgi:RNA polymerase sigma-70 factor (ECF subfamily)